MNSIADSDAVFDPGRTLVQHQAAITILQGMLTDPKLDRVRWLDLATGKGQILTHLQKNLTESARAKVEFVGYDIDNHNTRFAEKTADAMGFAKCAFGIGELSDFAKIDKTSGPWHLITLTNTVHEVSPRSLPSIIASALQRLDDCGNLFIYDMDSLPLPELGAVLWQGPEIREILMVLLGALGCPKYEPSVGTWVHRSCEAWNAQIIRSHMQLPEEWENHVDSAVDATAARIEELLNRKLRDTKRALDVLTRCGSESGAEEADKVKLLYDLWAITRALEDTQ